MTPRDRASSPRRAFTACAAIRPAAKEVLP